MSQDSGLRDLLARLLAWEDAHVGFDAAVTGIDAGFRGRVAEGLPHSAWQLVDHLRRTQHDILEFCVNPAYVELDWPADYWPSSPEPASDGEWNDSIRQFRADREALQRLAADPRIDLTERIPHGDGQTYGREIVLAADHAAYHVGQLILVRRALGIWK
jgi:hypothetical protein